MADNNRLLKVMVEEELGLSLQTTEHPLKQGLGAGIGVFIAAAACLLLQFLLPAFGLFVGATLTIAIASATAAYLAQNQTVPAIVWNLGIAVLALGCIYFLLEWYQLSINS
jgi:VIT1/CCC1 family predicted Fe2+/Mn2+ transporter